MIPNKFFNQHTVKSDSEFTYRKIEETDNQACTTKML